MKLALFFLIFCACPAFSAETISEQILSSCLPKEDVEKYNKDFHMYLERYKPEELCDSSRPIKKLLNAIYILDKGQFEKGQVKFAPGIVTYDYYAYLVSGNFKSITLDETGNSVAANVYIPGVERRMTVSPSKASYYLPMFLPAAMVHERRHNDDNGHVTCWPGGYGGCNKNFEEQGAVAVQIEYLIRVALFGKNFDPKLKLQAKMLAIALLGNFQKVPWKTTDSIAFIDGNTRKLGFYNGSDIAIKDEIVLSGSHLFALLENGTYDLYGIPEDPLNNPIRLLNIYSLPLQPEEINLAFGKPQSFFTAEDRKYFSSLKEWKKTDQRWVQLDQDTLAVSFYDLKQPQKIVVNLLKESLVPDHLTQVTPSGKRGWFLVVKGGKIYDIDTLSPNNGGKLKQIKEKWPNNIRQIEVLNGKNLALDTTGKIFDLSPDGQLLPIKIFEGITVSQIVPIKLPAFSEIEEK